MKNKKAARKAAQLTDNIGYIYYFNKVQLEVRSAFELTLPKLINQLNPGGIWQCGGLIMKD